MIRREQENESLPLINGIEKPVIADAIPPGLWHGIPELLDVFPAVGVLSKLGIDEGGELTLDASLLSTEVLLEVLLELRSLEETEFSQRACPSAVSRRDVPHEAWP